MPSDLEQILNSVNEQMDSDTTKGKGFRSAFVDDIKKIIDYFQQLRQRDSLGRRQMVGEKEKDELINLYKQAIRSAKTASRISNDQSVNLITEVRDILVKDYKTIEEVKPEENLSIDDTLDKSRTETIVVTDEKLRSAGANLSVRMPMTYTGKNGEQYSGFFTEESKVSAEAKFFEFFSELGKVDSKFKKFGMEFYALISENAEPEKKGTEAYLFMRALSRRAALLKQRNDIPAYMLDDDLSSKILAFESFYKETYPGHKIGDVKDVNSLYMTMQSNSKILKSAFSQAGFYINQLGSSEGSSIDKRNTAMSKVADLLGVGNLVARSVNMDVIVNGKKVKGTFMADAKGMDYNRRPKKHPAYNLPPDEQSGAGFKDVCDIMVLDYICGNVDRHAANLFYQFDENGKFTGVQGIDNDASFGVIIDKNANGMNRMAGPAEMPFISKSMATAVSDLTPEMLRFALEGNGLNDSQITAAVMRLSLMKKTIGKRNGPVILEDAEFKNKSAQFFINEAKENEPDSNYTYSVVAKRIKNFAAPLVGADRLQHAKAVQGVLSADVFDNSIETFAKALKDIDTQFAAPEMIPLLGEDSKKTVAGIRETISYVIKYNEQLKKNPNDQIAAVRASTCVMRLTKQSKELLDDLNAIQPGKTTKNALNLSKQIIEKVSDFAQKQIPVLKEAVEIHNKNTERSIDRNAADLAKAMEKINRMTEYQKNIYKTDDKGRLIMVKNENGRRVPALKEIKTPKEAQALCKAIKDINEIMQKNAPDDPSNSTGQVLIRDALQVLKSSATNEFDPMKLGGLTKDDLAMCNDTMQKGLTAAHETEEKKQEAKQLTESIVL